MSFKVKIRRQYRVFSCAAKLAEEARGRWYFHRFITCPDCRLEPSGFGVWGSNGHKQGEGPDAHLLHLAMARRGYEVSYSDPDYYRAY